MYLITAQQSREDVKDIGEALGLSDKTIEHDSELPAPGAYGSEGSIQRFYVCGKRQGAKVGGDGEEVF
jgi:hypothetical protein